MWHLSMSPSKSHFSLIIKALSNWVGKRRRSQAERKRNEIPEATVTGLLQLLRLLSGAASHSSSSVARNYVLLCYNIIIWLGRLRVTKSPLFQPILDTVTLALSTHGSVPKLVFYALLVIGSIAYLNPPVLQSLKENSSAQAQAVTKAVAAAAAVDNPVLREIAEDLIKLGVSSNAS